MEACGPCKAALVGAGNICEFHIRALRRLPGVRIVGITDLDESRARAVAERFGIAAVFPSLAAMGEASPDVVHILTPPDSHATLTLEALDMGCHVLVEKPLATSVEDCDAIAAAAKRAGRSVCVDHALLYDFFVRRALDAVRAGKVGQVVGVDYIRSQQYPPYRGGALPPQYREGGYPFRDVGIHALYLMEAFLGDILDANAQFVTRGGDPNLLYDEWQAMVQCRGGTGLVRMSWSARPQQHLLVVHGTRGILRCDLFGMSLTLRRPRPLPKPLENAFNTFAEGLSQNLQVPLNMARGATGRIMRYHGLQKLVEAFYASLADGRPAPVTPEQARNAVDFTERIARKADGSKQAFLALFNQPGEAKVLVTGALGFIGRRLLARLLEQEGKVRILARRQPPPELAANPHVEVFYGDLGDPDAVDRAARGIDTLYHVGAAIRGTSADLDRGTIIGTQNVVDAALRHGVRRFVHISSLSVLHATAAGDAAEVAEDWPLEPHPQLRGDYTRTKLEAERIVTRAIAERRLPAVILRPGMVFGDGAALITPAVALRVRNRLVILGDGKGVLPLVHVEDVVDAILEAGQRDGIEGAILHLVDEPLFTQDQLAREYAVASGRPMKITRLPRPIVYALAAGVQLLCRVLRRPAPLSVYRIRSALALRPFNCAAAGRILGWKPRVGVRAGLARTLDAIRTPTEVA